MKATLKLMASRSFGMPPAEREAVNRQIGMLFQGGALFDSLNVWENVAFGLIQGEVKERRAAKEIALEKLAAVGLGAEVGELSPAELSGGMQKRVGLARAIATEPEIIFFDEPTTGLDPIMGDVINDPRRQMRSRTRRDSTFDHSRHSERPQDFGPHRHVVQRKDNLGRPD